MPDSFISCEILSQAKSVFNSWQNLGGIYHLHLRSAQLTAQKQN
jgi:hypothetical protein